MTFAIEIPADALVITVGLPGSGKSTFIRRHFASAEISSLDRWREVLGRAGDQEATPYAKALAVAYMSGRLERGAAVVSDDVNLAAAHRREWAELAWRCDRPVVVLVFDTPAGECLRRNARRPPVSRVPQSTMNAYLEPWMRTAATIGDEGLGTVIVLGPAEMRATSVTRVASCTAEGPLRPGAIAVQTGWQL